MPRTRLPTAFLLPAALVVLPLSAQALTVTAQATDLKTGKALYTETHEISANGQHETITYVAADGQKIGTKVLDYGTFPYVPIYRLSFDADGYTEGLTKRGMDGRTVVLEKRSDAKSDLETATVAAEDGETLTATTGAERFIADNLPALAAGKVLPFRLAVAGRLDSYRLRVRKTGDVPGGIEVQIEPATLLRLLTPDLHIVFDLQTRRIAHYEGVSDVQDPVTHKAFKAVKIVYHTAG